MSVFPGHGKPTSGFYDIAMATYTATTWIMMSNLGSKMLMEIICHDYSN
jgi:hypothetical protein